MNNLDKNFFILYCLKEFERKKVEQSNRFLKKLLKSFVMGLQYPQLARHQLLIWVKNANVVLLTRTTNIHPSISI